jgi:hypothetical protein
VSTAAIVLAAQSPGPLDGVVWSDHPAAWLLLVGGIALAAVVGLASLVCLLGAAAPTLRAAADHHARTRSPGLSVLVGALTVVGVFLVLAWAAKAGPTPGAVAAIAIGLPAALALATGALAVVPLVGERALGARGISASPLSRALAGSLVLLGALVAGLALGPFVLVVLAIVVGWPLGVGLGAAFARRTPPTDATG